MDERGGGDVAEADDRALLRGWCERRDEAAFARLVDRHRAMVEGVCRRELAGGADIDDVAQEVFTAFADQAGDIRGAPGAWLRAAAVHRCLNLVRSRQRRRFHEQRAGVQAAGCAVIEEKDADEELLEACLAELGEDDRELLVRLFVHGQSQAEVARAAALSPLAVHRRVRRALDRLREGFRRRGRRMGAATLALALAGGDRALAAQVLGRGAAVPLAVLAAGAALAIAAGWWWLRGDAAPAASASSAVPASTSPQPPVAAVAAAAGAATVAAAGGPAAAGAPPAVVPVRGGGYLATLLAERPAGAPAAGAALLGFQGPRRPEWLGMERPSARPLHALPWAKQVALASAESPFPSCWLLAPDPGTLAAIVPTIDPSEHGGELVLLMLPHGAGEAPVTWNGRWHLLRQTVVRWPPRGQLEMVEEVAGEAQEAVSGRRAHVWRDRDGRGRPYTPELLATTRPFVFFPISQPVLLFDAWWREFSVDEAARLAAAHPATSGSVAEH